MLHWNLWSLLAFLPGVASLTVHGQKGGSVFLPSNSIGDNLSFRLTFGSKVAYGAQQNEQYKGRVIWSRGGLTIQDLKSTDAGKYTLSIYGHGSPTSISYEVPVNVNLTGRIGEELVFDDPPRDADKVVCCNGTVCTEMWIRGQGVLNDRLNDSNGHLVITELQSSDAGIYRFLNSTGGELLTVNVTVSGTESEGNDLNTTDDRRTDDTEQHLSWVWIVALVVLVVLAALIILIKRTRQHLNRNEQPDSYKVEMGESDQVLKYPFVTIAHENDDHNDGYRCICIPGANSRHEGA